MNGILERGVCCILVGLYYLPCGRNFVLQSGPSVIPKIGNPTFSFVLYEGISDRAYASTFTHRGTCHSCLHAYSNTMIHIYTTLSRITMYDSLSMLVGPGLPWWASFLVHKPKFEWKDSCILTCSCINLLPLMAFIPTTMWKYTPFNCITGGFWLDSIYRLCICCKRSQESPP